MTVPETLIKLTDSRSRTHAQTEWAIGQTVRPLAQGPPALCTDTVIHAYRSLPLALLVNPAHGSFPNDGLIYEASGEVAVDDGTKVGCLSLTPLRLLERPFWWNDPQLRCRVQVRYACLCARAVLHLLEATRPADTRPRRAIEAAERWLKSATDDAASAARAAYALAADAAYDLAYAALAYATAADAAAAARAAHAAYACAYAALAAYATHVAVHHATYALAYATLAADAAAFAVHHATRATYAAHVAATVDYATLAEQAITAEAA